MKFICLSLFPEMIENGLKTSVIGKAIEQGILQLKTYDIRSYTTDKHGSVDDYTYGGGAGMLLQAQPVYDAYCAALAGSEREQEQGKPRSDRTESMEVRDRRRTVRTIYVTPQGVPFTQKIAAELAREEELVFLCGHYEGVDERVLEETVTDRISIGDYVLTGGELAVMVMIDAISRLVPGVLGNETSADTESFHNDLLEYPQYTRPEVWHGKAVPQVLLSGDHAEIEKWRLKKSAERTQAMRPDLYQKYQQKQEVIGRLLKNKRNNIHMTESLKRGIAEILYDDGKNLLLYQDSCGVCMISVCEKEKIHAIIETIPAKASKMIFKKQENAGNLSDFVEFLHPGQTNPLSCKTVLLAYYPQNQSLRVKFKDIRPEESQECENRYGLYIDGVKYGEIEECADGSIGIPKTAEIPLKYMDEKCMDEIMHQVKYSLLAYMINRQRYKGFLPYLFVEEENQEIAELAQEAGMYLSCDRFIVTENSVRKGARRQEG